MARGAPDYTQRVELLGLDAAGNLVTVRLDPSGRIEALLQGQHAGALRPLATDAAGRLIAIVTDQQNIWGVRPLIGNAELAARLGALSVFDRRGSVVWQDDFSNGLGAWAAEWDGPDGNVQLDAEYHRRTGYSARLDPGLAAAQFASIAHVESPVYGAGSLGHESHVSFNIECREIHIELEHRLAARILYPALRYHVQDRTLAVHTPGGTWTVFATGVNLLPAPEAFHPFKLVVDLAAERYVRAVVSGREYSLSAFTPHSAALALAPLTRAVIKVVSMGVPGAIARVDCSILTVEEPP